MRISSLFSKCLISFLIPAIISQPLYGISDDTSLQSQSLQNSCDTSKLMTYDQILDFLFKLENGGFESTCDQINLERINASLVYWARAGLIPGDE